MVYLWAFAFCDSGVACLLIRSLDPGPVSLIRIKKPRFVERGKGLIQVGLGSGGRCQGVALLNAAAQQPTPAKGRAGT